MNPSPYYTSFKSAHTRAVIVKVLLIVGAVSNGLLLLTEALSLAVPPLVEDQDISENVVGFLLALIMFLVAILTILIYIATVITYCMWLYRSYNNLTAFGNSRLDHSAGWAVGSFFVPFINLFVPYRAIREVWQKSVPLEETFMSAPSPPAWFPLWWIFWIVGSIVTNVSTRMSFRGDVSESTATMFSIIGGALTIIAALLAYVVVNEIDKRQEETSRKLGLGKHSMPPTPPPPPANLQQMPSAYTPQ